MVAGSGTTKIGTVRPASNGIERLPRLMCGSSITVTPGGKMRWPSLSEHPKIRFVLLVLYYFAIIVTLFILYGRSGFSTPPFIYQGF